MTLESAWEKGNHYAGYQLGKLYLYGREVEADQEKAIAYLTASAEMGNQYAGQLLHSIRNNRKLKRKIDEKKQAHGLRQE